MYISPSQIEMNCLKTNECKLTQFVYNSIENVNIIRLDIKLCVFQMYLLHFLPIKSLKN
jgi:hypothetical protein